MNSSEKIAPLEQKDHEQSATGEELDGPGQQDDAPDHHASKWQKTNKTTSSTMHGRNVSWPDDIVDGHVNWEKRWNQWSLDIVSALCYQE